jgi:hypothetical protein
LPCGQSATNARSPLALVGSEEIAADSAKLRALFEDEIPDPARRFDVLTAGAKGSCAAVMRPPSARLRSKDEAKRLMKRCRPPPSLTPRPKVSKERATRADDYGAVVDRAEDLDGYRASGGERALPPLVTARKLLGPPRASNVPQ